MKLSTQNGGGWWRLISLQRSPAPEFSLFSNTVDTGRVPHESWHWVQVWIHQDGWEVLAMLKNLKAGRKVLRVRWCFQSVLYNVTMQTEKGLLVIQMTSFCNRLPRKIFTGWFFFLIKKNWFWPCLVAGEASQADLWVKSSPAMPEIQKTRFRSLRDLSSLTRDWTCAHCGRHVET